MGRGTLHSTLLGMFPVLVYPRRPESSNHVWRRTADHSLKHCDSCELLIVAYGLDSAAAGQVRQWCLLQETVGIADFARAAEAAEFVAASPPEAATTTSSGSTG